jgi:hypothetical protein
MASITTNPNSHVVNIFPFPNIITSATGSSTTNDSDTVAALQTYINTKNNSVKTNGLSAYSGSNITVTNNLVLSNAALYINGTSRFNSTGLGVGTTNPAATLDVVGPALIHGQLSVSSSLYASGDIYANGTYYPSDARLKKEVEPYRTTGTIDPVRFVWAKTGLPDIGVIAQEVWKVEPACVHSTSAGSLNVDYAKLVVVCLAELRDLRSTVRGLEVRMETASFEFPK